MYLESDIWWISPVLSVFLPFIISFWMIAIYLPAFYQCMSILERLNNSLVSLCFLCFNENFLFIEELKALSIPKHVKSNSIRFVLTHYRKFFLEYMIFTLELQRLENEYLNFGYFKMVRKLVIFVTNFSHLDPTIIVHYWRTIAHPFVFSDGDFIYLLVNVIMFLRILFSSTVPTWIRCVCRHPRRKTIPHLIKHEQRWNVLFWLCFLSCRQGCFKDLHWKTIAGEYEKDGFKTRSHSFQYSFYFYFISNFRCLRRIKADRFNFVLLLVSYFHFGEHRRYLPCDHLWNYCWYFIVLRIYEMFLRTFFRDYCCSTHKKAMRFLFYF